MNRKLLVLSLLFRGCKSEDIVNSFMHSIIRLQSSRSFALAAKARSRQTKGRELASEK